MISIKEQFLHAKDWDMTASCCLHHIVATEPIRHRLSYHNHRRQQTQPSLLYLSNRRRLQHSHPKVTAVIHYRWATQSIAADAPSALPPSPPLTNVLAINSINLHPAPRATRSAIAIAITTATVNVSQQTVLNFTEVLQKHARVKNEASNFGPRRKMAMEARSTH